MKTIPQVREELMLVASVINNLGYSQLSNKLKRLIKDMHRRPSVRKAAKESAPFTPELAVRIKNYADIHPSLSYIKIGKRFNVSIGRVSEALAGLRAA